MTTNDATPLRFAVFGRTVHLRRSGGAWRAFYPGPDGKTRSAHDLLIPGHLEEAELTDYLFDLCHEWATPAAADVRRLDEDEEAPS